VRLNASIPQQLIRGRAKSTRFSNPLRPQVNGFAQVVETEAVGQLPLDQADHMAPRLEGARLRLDSGGACDLGDFVGRNEVADLAQDGGNLPPAGDDSSLSRTRAPVAEGWEMTIQFNHG
jgi:hypothetical protein